ncbi:MAG: hypothetical protein HUU21_37715 [Polyangiaceae bacterium]|nr:hypothetical protein [Polyangiaceae bacterium]
MNMSRRQQQVEREERRADRDRREVAAGKLLAKIPNLTSLRLAIRESRASTGISENQYVRHVVVGSAPALFEIRCSNAGCEDGVCDFTREILAALASGRSSFEGERPCPGRCRTTDCPRILHYVATATYQEPLTAQSR